MNPLYNMLGGGAPMGNMGQMMQQLQQFKNTFKGDPKAEVHKLLQSGRLSQSQLDQLQQVASQLQHLMQG